MNLQDIILSEIIHSETNIGVNVMAMWVRLLLAIVASHIGVLITFLAAPLSTQLPVNGPGKAAEKCIKYLVPAVHTGIPGFLYQLGFSLTPSDL